MLRGTAAPKDPASDEDRTVLALRLVAKIEARERALPRATGTDDFLLRGRVARRSGTHGEETHLLPVGQREGWHDVRGVRTERVAVAADTVVLAKFDLAGHVKMRALYRRAGLTLSVQPRDGRGSSGVQQAVRSHAVVDAVAPGLAPPLVAHGRASRAADYLVEEWVEGEPLVTGRALARVMPLLVQELARLYRGHGVGWTRPTSVWSGSMAPAWEAVLATGLVDDELWRPVARLIVDDRPMRTTWVHGDPVASNILRTAEGITLVDWEHSAPAALMVDMAKLHLFTAEPDRALDAMDDLLPTGGGRSDPPTSGRMSPGEELALMHARHLMGYPLRSRTLAGHPRARTYEKQVRRQVERLGSALQRAAGPGS